MQGTKQPVGRGGRPAAASHLKTETDGDREAEDNDDPRQGMQQAAAAVLQQAGLAVDRLTRMTRWTSLIQVSITAQSIVCNNTTVSK